MNASCLGCEKDVRPNDRKAWRHETDDGEVVVACGECVREALAETFGVDLSDI